MDKVLILWVLIMMTQPGFAQTSISGTITDEQGLPLQGATISLDGTDSGAATDENGNYTLSSDESLPWNLEVRFVGYASRFLTINAPGDQGITYLQVALLQGEAVIVSASRIPEKAVEAVASVSSVSSQLLQTIPVNGDLTEYLRNVPGANIIRSGTQISNIELRGPVNILETSTLILKDFAPLTASSDKILITPASSLSPLDLASIEIVRGPSGALYGPNVTSGVVHYVTKDPFKYPGVSAMVSVGERNLFTSRVRYADNNGKWGWKFLANYSQSNDFAIAEDQLIANDGITKVVIPQNFETLGGKRWDNVDNLNDIRLNNWNFEIGLEYRANDKTKVNYTATLSRLLGNRAIPIGHLFGGRQRFEHQVRLNTGNFFGTIYHRHDFANISDSGNPNNLADQAFSVNYTAGVEGETQVATPRTSESFFDLALQYRIELNESLNIQLGSDIKLSPAFESIFIYGASSGNNAYNIYGGYLSGKYKLNDRLALNAAGRVDYFSAYDETAFSPRLGLVYNPREKSAIRLSFSRSYEGQSRERAYLDFDFTTVLPPFFPASRINGVAQTVAYDNPVTKFAFGNVTGGELFELQDIVDALAVHAGVPSPMVSGTTAPDLTTATFASPGVGQSTGVQITLDEAGLEPPILRTVNQIEVGYSNTLHNKLNLGIDLYHTWIENIQPTGEVVLTAGSQLNVMEVQTMIEQQVSAGPVRDGLITSLYSVPFNPTPNPGFDGTPGFGAVMSDRAQGFNYIYDLGFPTYGNQNVNYMGVDLSLSYNFTPDLSAFSNYTYLSKTVWEAADLEEKNPEYKYYLNSAPDRINLGVNYYPVEGIYGSLAMNYQSEYEGRQGDGRFFTGINEARTIFDLQIGYRLMTTGNVSFDIGVSVNNVFDKKYSHFVHLGQLRRFGAVTLKVSL